jgi:alpha-tubulin suppressor-like RCC1 family protein
MTSSNYQTNSVDLDSTYIVGNDPNYQGIQAAVTNRKTVVFGQQLLTQTYPIGNLNGAINYAQSLPGTLVDQDSTTITGVGPTSVFYKSRSTGQSLIRASFGISLENYPQSGYWQINSYQPGISSPAQININGWTSIGSFYLGSNLGLQSNGTLWSWGNNNAPTGQLGNNSTNTLVNPTQLGSLSNWARISCGYAFAGIQSNGTLWIWGQNLYGQLGLSDTTSRSSPVQVGALSVWSQIFCGYGSTYAIQSNGTLWAWGQGGQGQLGNLSTTNISSPVKIGTVSIWAKVLGSAGSGGQYTIGLQSNGTLWSWGSGNNYYVLGQGNLTSYSTPVQIGSTSTWSNIATGSFFTLALQNNGTLWSWGLNNAGQLGLNDQITRSVPTQVGALSAWTQVACGYSHTLAIQSNGTLWAWGQNNSGQLGLNTTTNYSSPVQVGALSIWTQVSSYSRYNSLGIQNNGTLWSWGNNSYSQLGLVPYGITVTKITYGF